MINVMQGDTHVDRHTHTAADIEIYRQHLPKEGLSETNHFSVIFRSLLCILV